MKKVAVVGGGVAGIVSAYLLERKYQVTLIEKNDYVGGHTNTIEIPEKGLAVDTGFIVLNDKTYPNMHKFLKELDVPVRYSDMSFGYYCENTNLQYAGTDLNGLFADRKNLFKPSFLKMLLEIGQFSKQALEDLENDKLAGISLGEYLKKNSFSKNFVDHYVVPVGAAIWSSSNQGIFDFPAETYIQFFKNHGLLSFKDRPTWQTVVGGSYSYVKAFLKKFKGRVLTEKGVIDIVRRGGALPPPDSAGEKDLDQVEINFSDGSSETYDLVVIATHADQALRLLSEPSEDEERILGAWSYHKNHTILHTETSVLPPLKRAWASWNYRRTARADHDSADVFVSYYMNHLQGFEAKETYSVSLNCPYEIDQRKIVKEINYEHPAYTLSSIASQKELHKLQGVGGVYFAGSYFGYGFHEDAIKSGVNLAKSLGVEF